ncbi:RNI-like protein [Gigaspora margarita]|uniref:RNI-like protein n=1 Tax=Gigaspora margarita TaxID=4874 RepID=A0A8H4EG94_GIGMA|nr:RNI-like protein [Gigaspora margarita]
MKKKVTLPIRRESSLVPAILNLWKFKCTVDDWIELFNSKSHNDDTSSHHITNLLFKFLIESGAILLKFSLCFSKSLEFKPEIFYSLGQNVQFFSQIQHLSFVLVDLNIESATTWLRALAKNVAKIRTLKFCEVDYNGHVHHVNDMLPLIYSFIYIIKSQEQLRKFSLFGISYITKFHGIISALESQKNSLQEFRIDNCNFSAEFEVLNNCKNLDILRIMYCNPILSKLSNILDYKISTLQLTDYPIDARSIALILKKSGILLQRLCFESDHEINEEPLLLEAIKSFCPNITCLRIVGFVFSTQFIELIGNFQKLQFLSLWCNTNDIPYVELKIRIIQFSKILPLTLEDIYLFSWLQKYVDIFFNHCNTPLKKLSIYEIYNEKIFKALVEFCIRIKTLNYVSVIRYLKLDDNFKKELETYVALVPYKHDDGF